MAAKKKDNATAAEKAKEAVKKKQEAEKKKSSNMTCSNLTGSESDVAGFAPQPQMRAKVDCNVYNKQLQWSDDGRGQSEG